jgi:hypothetical protein
MPNSAIQATDVPLMAPLIQAQADMQLMSASGGAAPAVLNDFVSQVVALSAQTYSTTSSQVQTWATEFFTLLTTTQIASLGTPVTVIYIGYWFTLWWNWDQETSNTPDSDPNSGYDDFVDNYVSEGIGVPGGLSETVPAVWLNSLGQYPRYIYFPGEFNTTVPSTLLTFPTYWTDYSQLPAGSTLWSEQAAELAGMIALSSITADQAIYLLYLLMAQATSNTSDLALVNQLSATRVSSPEFPNGTLADHIAYLALTQMADPNGLNCSNAQMVSFAAGCTAALANSAPGSALYGALASQAALVTATVGYPLQDPFNVTLSFSQRVTDLLAAINQAWPALQSLGAAGTAYRHIIPNTSTGTPSPALQPGDELALAPMILALNDMNQMQSSSGGPLLSDFMSQVDNLCRAAWPPGNSQIAAWVTDLFSLLCSVETTSGTGIGPGAYLAGVYGEWAFTPWWNQYSESGDIYAYALLDFVEGELGWSPPANPSFWASAIQDSVMSVSLETFPDCWTGCSALPAACTIWSAQSTVLTQVAAQSTLGEDQCPFLLYLLAAQFTSPVETDQQLAQTLAEISAPSAEFRQFNLAGQLLYFTLMYLASPYGPAWTASQLLQFVQSLIAGNPGTAASAPMSAALAVQLQALQGSPNYPMINPNNSSVDFRQRYADTLAAINIAWANYIASLVPVQVVSFTGSDVTDTSTDIRTVTVSWEVQAASCSVAISGGKVIGTGLQGTWSDSANLKMPMHGQLPDSFILTATGITTVVQDLHLTPTST